MRKTLISSIVAACIMTVLVATAGAMPPLGENQKGYNPEMVDTVKCVVKEVGQVTQVWGPIKGMSYGVNLKVKTDRETLTVYLGPAWYIERQDLRIGENDTIEVKGCKKVFDGEPVIVAREVRKNDVVLKLRDKEGNPVWAGKARSVSYE